MEELLKAAGLLASWWSRQLQRVCRDGGGNRLMFSGPKKVLESLFGI